jgi:hypothetical protein
MTSWNAGYSTCLDLAVDLAMAASTASIRFGESVTFTATLHVADNPGDGRLTGNPVSRRTVMLQRRAPGGTTWTTVGQMLPLETAGTYALKQSPGSTYDWRAVFPDPVEGLRGDTTGAVRVAVLSCTRAPCPQAVPSSTGGR